MTERPALYPRHSLNIGFEWQPATGPFWLISQDQADRYNRDGHFRLDGAFPAETIASVIAAIDPLEAQAEAYLRTRENKRLFISRADEITFRPGLVKESSVLRAFCGHAVFQSICHDLLGDDVRLYHEQSVYKKPEMPLDFPWHQDNGYTFVQPQQYVTCWVPLTDATIENGCPWVIPGEHLSGTLEHWLTDTGLRCIENDPRAIPVEAPAGSIVVFSSLTPHRTGPNTTSAVRKTYIVQFAPDGAAVTQRDGTRVVANDPARQFELVRNGERVAPPV